MPKKGTVFKVWIEVERIEPHPDGEGEVYQIEDLPWAGEATYDTWEEALAHATRLHEVSQQILNPKATLGTAVPTLDLSKDFFTLSHAEVQIVIDMAKAAKYRKPKNANGSTARYYYARLQRKARKG